MDRLTNRRKHPHAHTLTRTHTHTSMHASGSSRLPQRFERHSYLYSRPFTCRRELAGIAKFPSRQPPRMQCSSVSDLVSFASSQCIGHWAPRSRLCCKRCSMMLPKSALSAQPNKSLESSHRQIFRSVTGAPQSLPHVASHLAS